jgi:hypothetical protein
MGFLNTQYSVRTLAILVEAWRLFCSTSSLNFVFSLNAGTLGVLEITYFEHGSGSPASPTIT